MDANEVPKNVLDSAHTEAQQYLVRFFGQPVTYGWMELCLPFREYFDEYSHERDTYFQMALREALEYEETGGFLAPKTRSVVPQEDGDDEENEEDSAESPIKKSKRQKAESDDDDFERDDDSDLDEISKPKSRNLENKNRIRKTRKSANMKRKLRSSCDIFQYVKKIRTAYSNKNYDEALSLLKIFDPASKITSDGQTLENPYSNLDAFELKTSRLGHLLHYLAKNGEKTVKDTCGYLYRHFLNRVNGEFFIPEDLKNMNLTPQAQSNNETQISSKNGMNDNNVGHDNSNLNNDDTNVNNNNNNDNNSNTNKNINDEEEDDNNNNNNNNNQQNIDDININEKDNKNHNISDPYNYNELNSYQNDFNTEINP